MSLCCALQPSHSDQVAICDRTDIGCSKGEWGFGPTRSADKLDLDAIWRVDGDHCSLAAGAKPVFR